MDVPRPAPWQHLVPIVFCGALLALVVRTHLTEDDRWGFCMFRDYTTWQVAYRWEHADGSMERVDTTGYLRGEGKMIAEKSKPAGTILGIGAIRAMVSEFTETMGTWYMADDAVAIVAELRWRRYDRGRPHVESFRWPPLATEARTTGTVEDVAGTAAP